MKKKKINKNCHYITVCTYEHNNIFLRSDHTKFKSRMLKSKVA